jgi:hypothetical protein
VLTQCKWVELTWADPESSDLLQSPDEGTIMGRYVCVCLREKKCCPQGGPWGPA